MQDSHCFPTAGGRPSTVPRQRAGGWRRLWMRTACVAGALAVGVEGVADSLGRTLHRFPSCGVCGAAEPAAPAPDQGFWGG